MLEARQLACVRGTRVLFRDLDFSVEAGRILWVSGQNGAGKTSLLRLLCGLSRPAMGAVTWRGEPIETNREDFQRDLVYLGHLNALKDDLSAQENLGYLLGDGSATRSVDSALGARGLAMCAHLPVRVLSQGQKRRVALTRLGLSHARPLWILDEPFAALDALAIEDLSGLIATHARGGGVVVMTSHQEVALGDVAITRLELAGGMGAA